MAVASPRPSIPAERFAARLEAARAGAAEAGLDALLVGVGPDLVYLAGYRAMPLERLTMLVVPATGRPTLVVPRLEHDPAARSPAGEAGLVDIVDWEETGDPHAIVAGIASRDRSRPRRVAVSDTLWALHVLRLEAAMPDASFTLGSTVTSRLRILKDPDEIELLRLAAEAADRVVEQIASGRLVGRTEADVAREVRDRLIAEGHETAEFAIVASGPNSASPHHEPGDRPIEAGEPIVLDIGGLLGGYASDVTRTLWVTGGDPERLPDPEFGRIFDAVREAQSEATAAARPGVTAERIDAVARALIESAGYGEHFIHRTGHGIGLEGHEQPYVVAGDQTALADGMAFSVEPGIYLEGRYGVRLEDIVVCTAEGPVSLNRAPLDLRVVDG
ncbi:MAG TPA: Xaa-Pro peptidase family protein [Candidatus Limnocylindrales bacterium]